MSAPGEASGRLLEDREVIEVYHQQLDRQEAAAQNRAGRAFSRAFYHALYRLTELSLQLILWMRFTSSAEPAIMDRPGHRPINLRPMKIFPCKGALTVQIYPC